MPPNKVYTSTEDAVADILDGAVIMVAGFARPGTPQRLLKALIDKGVVELTCISGPWYSSSSNLWDVTQLVANGQVKKVIAAPPIVLDEDTAGSRLRREGRLEVELVAQGSLTERIRAGGAGIGGIYLPVQEGTSLDDGKERQVIDGVECVLETPLRADFALTCAHKADTLGNLVYRLSQRNWNPIMAMAADVTIVEVEEIVQPGGLDPEHVITPSIYVDRIVASGGER